MNEQKVKGILGFAAKARQISAGMDACRLLVRSGRCGILLIDDLTGPNTRKKAADHLVLRLAAHEHITLEDFFEKYSITASDTDKKNRRK